MTSDAPGGGAPSPPAPPGAWDGLRVLVLSPVPTWPITLGNRNRIVQVNRALQREGARVSLLHYPSDDEWRVRLPRAALAEMARQWDEVFTCPVTRPLHTRPSEGEDHAADDWWDPAIGQMLDWLFKVGRYDALLVNYTWLSKALEHAPAGVLRILDTHDRFSDRRALLAQNGLPPEYFHTTQDQERLALDRADLVWAIKDQEAEFFRTITARPVRTLLHAEPLRAAPPPAVTAAAPAAPDRAAGVLRLGIVGGRNNINASNIRGFLKTADAYLRRTLLPIEIVVGGSVCDLLEGLRLPYLRLLGRVEEMDELYDQVDAVLAPLAFSTGLKIKVGEALSRGKPLISHVHAFEGYVATHPFHECADFDAMMRAIHRLVRDPAALDTLAEASRRSVDEAAAGIADTLADAGRRAGQLPPSVVVSLRFDQARLGALGFDHLLDAARYAGFRAPVVFHFAGEATAADPAALRLLAARGRAVVDPRAAPLPDDIAEILFDDAPPRLASLGALLHEPHLMAWFAAMPDHLPCVPVRTRLGTCHLGALSLDGGLPDPLDVAALARAFPRFLLLEETPSHDAAVVMRAAGAERVLAPLLWRGEESRLLAALRGSPPGPVALICADVAARDILPVLACLTGLLGREVTLFCPPAATPPAWPTSGPLAVRAEAVTRAPLAAFFAPASWATRRPAFILEHGRPRAALPAREVALRAGIAHLRFGDDSAPAVVPTAPAMSYRTRGFVSTALVLSLLDRRDGTVPPNTGAPEEYGRDAGWARLWGELGRLVAA
ncbi:glycosyltransferase family 4 protein [Roseomonas sp. CECT 9278]|uniref:glycosyltransferase n=1 Tax=Roseomonas sp. CECT 9278 TaxID=2845823 RepID=UPI001E46BA87|nr:glycosyltransferase family 4 protein [Roseomonas sp. CECT 9278]